MDTSTCDKEYTDSLGGDIKKDLNEILCELRGQKNDLSELKNEVKGNSLNYAEMKKLKTENDIRWRFEGNKIQYQFNSELEDIMKQGLWAIENGKPDYAKEVMKDIGDKLHMRKKHIRIADTCEGGWETVKQYKTNPLASDSEDESRINRAESRAIKRKKNGKKNTTKSTTSVNHVSNRNSTARALGGASNYGAGYPFQPPTPFNDTKFGAFRGYSGNPFQRNFSGPIGPCYACGELNHLRRQCPYTRGTKQPDNFGKQ